MPNDATRLIYFIILIFVLSVRAVFVDEAYHIDYHYALLGVPQAQTTFFHRPSTTSKASLLYTLSKQRVLGAINPKDGTIVWRQRLTNSLRGRTPTGLLKASDQDGTIYSAVDACVQAWDASDGRLIWEWGGSGDIHGLEVSRTSTGDEGIYVLSRENSNRVVVRRFSRDSGTVLWEFEDER